MSKISIFAVCLALSLTLSLAGGALAQCGSGSGYMHDQHMSSFGQMMSRGQMGMYCNQPPVQTDPNAVAPVYVAPTPPAYGYVDQQNNGGSGQMMGQGGLSSGHQGHTGH